MNIHIYDTHVRTSAGLYLHFDVLVNEENKSKVIEYAQAYLTKQGISADQLTLNSCEFCHSEMGNPEVIAAIKREGHHILQLARINENENEQIEN